MPVSLRGVDPLYGIVRRRSSIAGPGALVLGSVFAFLFVFGWFNGRPEWYPIGAAIDAVLAVVCLVTGIRFLPKTEYYAFQREGGGLAFDIARSGPDRERFEQFVNRVVERVMALKQAAKPDQSPAPTGPLPKTPPPEAKEDR
jgi:hypothetical protein